MFTNSKSRIVAGILILGTTGLAFPVFAQDEIAAVTAAEQINSANELVRQGDFDKAIEEYQRVTASAKDRDELNYNQAVAQYRKGNVETAEALFTEAASSSDTSIAASSRYNLGNCLYAKALQSVEQDKPAAIEQLRQAIDHYRGSLNGNPENPDARANIELAAELIKKLQEEQKQEDQRQQDQQQQDQQQQDQQQQDQQQQDQQQQDQQQQDQQQDQQQQDQQQQDSQQSQSENADSQKSDPEETQDSKSLQDSESKGNEDQQKQNQSQESKSDDQHSQPQSEQSDSEEQAQSEPNNSEQSKPENDQSQNDESDSQDQQNAEQTDQRPPRQASQGNQQENNEPQPADEQIGDESDDQSEQQIPTGELTSAGQEDDNEKPTGSVAMADPNAKDSLMTQEEALKMLQAVRDRDMLRRLKQQQQERSRHVPVDRDW